MSIETFAPDRIGPSDEPESSRFDLDEERWLALPDEAKVAFAIASLETEQESFEHAIDISDAIKAMTELDQKAMQRANSALIKDRLNRTGFGADGTVMLSLNEKGYKYLEEEIAKVQ